MWVWRSKDRESFVLDPLFSLPSVRLADGGKWSPRAEGVESEVASGRLCHSLILP